MDVVQKVSDFFSKEHILLHAALPLNACRVIDGALLERKVPGARSVILYVLPYFVGRPEKYNISLYAQSKDYHILLQKTGAELCALLSSLLPEERFASFGDISPLDERRAFASAGLGILGDNGLLITEKYGSFVFLGEVISTAAPETVGASAPVETRGCLHCGACKNACPMRFEDCASGIGQKKGDLTPGEEQAVIRTGLIWGCDSCQICCPLNREIEKTPLPFFYEERVEVLTKDYLDALPAKDLRARAFGWRGRQPLARNLALFEKSARTKTKNG